MVSRCGAVGINNNNNQPPPPAMITLDLWLPPSHVLDSWDVLDSGQLGPAARLSFIHHHNRKRFFNSPVWCLLFSTQANPFSVEIFFCHFLPPLATTSQPQLPSSFKVNKMMNRNIVVNEQHLFTNGVEMFSVQGHRNLLLVSTKIFPT